MTITYITSKLSRCRQLNFIDSGYMPQITNNLQTWDVHRISCFTFVNFQNDFLIHPSKNSFAQLTTLNSHLLYRYYLTMSSIANYKTMYKPIVKLQHSFLDFNQPMSLKMNPENRWFKMADRIPWEEFKIKYHLCFQVILMSLSYCV